MSALHERKSSEEMVSKRKKVDKVEEVAALPSSIIVNFVNSDGVRAGPPVDLPMGSTLKQLELLVNALLNNDDPLPYAFYLSDIEVNETLLSTVEVIHDSGQSLSLEEGITISYQPLSVFRVHSRI